MDTQCAVTTAQNISLASGIVLDHVQLGAMARLVSSSYDAPINVSDFSCINRCQIGKYFNLGLFSYISDAVIGRYCSFGSRLSVGAFNHPTNWLSVHEFQYRDTSAIWGETLIHGKVNLLRNPQEELTNIGSDVWIGDNAVVLKGVSIGHGAIIGASSVVTRNIPPYAIAVGNPAQIKRFRFSPELISALLETNWWDYDMEDLKGLPFEDVPAAVAILKARKMKPGA
jgi:acetyltransferase-like isoleucine patch superfamily enzyme